MLIIYFTLLFISAFVPGLLLNKGNNISDERLKLYITFSGAYLFSITVIHILPELYEHSHGHSGIGIFVLIGFFFQIALEYFSKGIEHGHIHTHTGDNHKSDLSLTLVTALLVHAFLEGTMLLHPSHHEEHSTINLLFGIIVHKIPAAIALVAVLKGSGKPQKNILISLLIFSLASPAGLMFNYILTSSDLISEHTFMILFALVAGNFLHISTTIFYESSPHHKFNAMKLGVSILGAFLAYAAEVWV